MKDTGIGEKHKFYITQRSLKAYIRRRMKTGKSYRYIPHIHGQAQDEDHEVELECMEFYENFVLMKSARGVRICMDYFDCWDVLFRRNIRAAREILL